MAKQNKPKVKPSRRYTIGTVLATIFVCAIIGGMVSYHIASVQAAEKHGYIAGSEKTLESIQSILTAPKQGQ